ncbi:MAG: hypothetical protein EA385_05095 [Salinarimonadaceae bacterium]|nr:MAG: hypothetical protein EA385_05095 [Salinarimonadaceae bacterium]
MAIAEIIRKHRRASGKGRGERAQTIHLRDAARLAGEAFAFDDDGRDVASRPGAGWNAAAGMIVAGVMLLFGA